MIFAQALDYTYHYHLPWFFKLSLVGLAIRVFVWLINQLPKENKLLRRAAPKPRVDLPPPYPVTPAGSTHASDRDVLVWKDGQQFGPYRLEEINRRLAAHVFELSDLAWYEGLAERQPLESISGVVHCQSSGSQFSPPPVRTAGWSSPDTANPAAPSSTGLLIGGYVCAAVSLLFLPPVLGLAGIICGVVVIKRQRANQGVALLVVSFVCAVVGMILGAAS